MGKKGDAQENARRKAQKRLQKQQKQMQKQMYAGASASVRTQLKRLGLRVKAVEPDGNCQFRAVADQLFGDPERYREVRTMAMNELERNVELYKGFVTDDEPFDAYVARMRDEAEWGDMTTLMALAAASSLRVIVHQNDTELPRYELVPHHGTVKKTIHVLFDASAEHYDSIRATGDGEMDEPPREIPWMEADGRVRPTDDGDNELADELATRAQLDDDDGKGKGKKVSAREKRAAKGGPKAKSKKQLQAELQLEAAEQARRDELAKTLVV